MNFRQLKQTEKQICRDFVRQFDYLQKLNQFKKKLYLFHIANEQGINSASYTKSLFSIGLRPGVADYCLLIEGGGVAFLEFKRDKKSKLSAYQQGFQEVCSTLGIPYVVVSDVEYAIDWIKCL